jgi:hypothetical protein
MSSSGEIKRPAGRRVRAPASPQRLRARARNDDQERWSQLPLLELCGEGASECGESAAGGRRARAGDADCGHWGQPPLRKCAEWASGCGESAAGGRGTRAADAD